MFSSFPKTNFNSLVTFIMLSASAFNLDQFKILLFGKVLSHYNIFDWSKLKAFAEDEINITLLFTTRQIFRRVQIASICRRQKKFLLGMGRKRYPKMTKCWLPAFSSFSTIFPKGFFFKVVISQG